MRTIQDDFQKHPVTMYLNQIESDNGKQAMATALRRALAAASGENIRNVSMQEVYTFPWPTVTNDKVASLKAKLIESYAGATAAQTLSAVKGVMGACFDMGLIDGDQLMRIQRIDGVKVRNNPQVGRYVKRSEIEKLKEVLEAERSRAAARDLAIIGLFYHQGPRVSEICQLRHEDYDPVTGRLIIREGKGRKPRLNVLQNGAKAALDEWLAERGDWEGPLFCPVHKSGEVVQQQEPLTRWAITKMLEKRQEQAGLDHFSPHDFRRTVATELIEAGGIRKAQRILGHEDISTTALYDKADLEAALELSAAREF